MKRITTYFIIILSLVASFSFAAAQTTSDARCPQINQNLYRGLRDVYSGGDIYRLQRFLAQEGLLSYDNTTGYFGALTERALAAWQARNGINPAGSFGPITRRAVAARCGTSITPIVPITPPQSCPPITMQYPYCPYGTVVPQKDYRGCTLSYVCSTTNNPYTGYGTPVISSFSGPTTLQVGQTGTWSVIASDPQNEQLTYSIRWGDEGTNYILSAMPASQTVYNQTSTYTHVYSVPGTYTVTITVRDPQGLEARSTATVVVSGSNYGYSNIRVTYPNDGGTFSKNQTVNIGWTDINTYIQAQRYDIYVSSYLTPCTSGYACPLMAQYRYPIATSVYGASYQWTIPEGINNGQYVIEVCSAGAYSCDQSDTPFTISGTTSNESVYLSVNPISGNAPLTVNASISVSRPSGVVEACGTLTFGTLEWGDGATETLTYLGCSGSTLSWNRSHTYSGNGTYTVRVLRNGVYPAQLNVSVSGSSSTRSITTASVNKSQVQRGDTITTTWSSTGDTRNDAVALQLLSNGVSYGYMAVGQSTSGTYTWTVPTSNTVCPADSPYACGYNLDNRTYTVRAILYTPFNACFGFCASGTQPTILSTRDAGTFTIGTGSSSADSLSLVVNSDPSTYGKSITLTVVRPSVGNESCTSQTYGTLEWGDGSSESLTYTGCTGSTLTFTKTHTYSGNGTYTVRVIKNSSVVLSNQLTVGSGSSGSTLTATPDASGYPYVVTITTRTPQPNTTCGINGTLLVDYGDGTSTTISSPYVGSSSCAYQTNTFTHYYNTPGSYSISVRNNSYPYEVLATQTVSVN